MRRKSALEAVKAFYFGATPHSTRSSVACSRSALMSPVVWSLWPGCWSKGLGDLVIWHRDVLRRASLTLGWLIPRRGG